MRRVPGRGFTLVELMVVLAIIGILVSVAVVTVRTEPTAADEARHTSVTISQAIRVAIAGGPVRDDIATAATEARARVRVEGDPSAGTQRMVIERLIEGETAGEYSWVLAESRSISSEVQIIGYSDGSAIDAGTSPDVIYPVALGSDTDDAAIDCLPTGRCEAKTLYLRDRRSGKEPHRVVVLQFGASPVVLSGW